MSRSSPVCLSDTHLDLPRLPQDAAGPVFVEPWHAQAFALAITLTEQGHFTRAEWATTLGAELVAAAARGEPDDGSRYYEHWVTALERLIAQKGLATAPALDARKAAWRDAFRHTPHGRPVELAVDPSSRLSWLALACACTVAAVWALHSGDANVSPETAGETLGRLAGVGPAGALGLVTSAGLGTVLGMRHALEPDHLAAVSALMTGERTSGTAAWLGACWGVGHAATLLATGLLLATFHAEMPAVAARVFELAVVVTLVGFGLRAIHLAAGGRPLTPGHRHDASAPLVTASRPRSLVRPLAVGALHGLAGSGAVMAIVATALPSAAAQLGYLLMFGAGSIAGMAVLSGVLGWPLARLGMHHVVTRCFSLLSGAVSVAIGMSWGLTLLRVKPF